MVLGAWREPIRAARIHHLLSGALAVWPVEAKK
jgi:hypothetical protein